MFNKLMSMFNAMFEDDTQGDVLALDEVIHTLKNCDLCGEQAELEMGACAGCYKVTDDEATL